MEPEYLGDLQARPMTELRAMRAECQELEVTISYLRRLAQGRLDIVGTVKRRRLEGGEPVDLHAIVESLTDILSDRGRPAGNGRLPQLLAPSAEDADTSDLDAIIPAGRLGDLPQCDDSELDGIIVALQEYEQDASARRRALHDRIDAVQAEMTRRYRTGEASVESLLQ